MKFCTIFNSFLSAFLLSTIVSPVFAQDAIEQNIKFDGTNYAITMTEAQKAVRKLVVWGTSKGNVSQNFSAHLEGPNGIKAKVEAFIAGPGTASDAALKDSGWFPVELRNSKGKSVKQMNVKVAQSARELELRYARAFDFGSITSGLNGGGICQFISAEELQTMLAQYAAMLGRPITKEQLCSGNIGGGDSDGGSSTNEVSDIPIGYTDVSGTLHKDTCREPQDASYRVRMVIDLSAVPESAYDAKFPVKVGFTFATFKGENAASLKPDSDGKYHGSPIIIMTSLGGFGLGSFFGGGASSEYFNVVRWNRSKIKYKKSFSVGKYAFARGLVLAVSPISSYMSGGKGVFELTNDQQIYSVCFNLVRQRQFANGYPTS